MTSDREKVNEAISSWFEPKPTTAHGGLSPKECWRNVTAIERAPSRMSAAALESGALAEIVYEWQPLDYFTDEAANARLLEAMPMAGIRKQEDGRWAAAGDYSPKGCSMHSDRKTAIVLAFCKFAGIEVGGEG